MSSFELSGKCALVYELIKSEELGDIQSKGYLLRHIKSGARVAIVENSDENKVFSIGFRTPPNDSTGVPHIIEHSVLCGSKNYPVKDPFVELVKGSLNTFLNAMTYSDKTVYPVASCNHKDFANLMNVYMDAVFYPRMYDIKEIFEQEGWHYEMNSPEDPLTINGVVYNEMRGAFSSPDQILARLVEKALFPDTAYGYESGGDPDNIPELTYEDFLDFHKRYYHPSNSYIYLYGDMDIEERLLWMDSKYLRFFDRIELDSEIRMQKPFSEQKDICEKYSAQSDDDKAYFSYNCVIDKSDNKMFQLAFNVLSYALVQVPGSPLKQALIDAGISADISCSYDGEILQPVFSVVAREADAARKNDFVKIIKDTLNDLCKNGIDKKSLQAAIAGYEFRYREADFGRFPKGLMYGLEAMSSWLYDENEPFMMLLQNDLFDEMKKLVDTDYFEKLIKEYLIDNTHSAVVCVFPEEGLSKKKDDELAKKLEEYKQSLSESEIQEIINNTEKLHVYQETPDTPKDLETIPLLKREDLSKEARKIYIDKKEMSGVPVLHHNIYTNGIAYVNLAFDVTRYEEYIPYINLLSFVLGTVDTVNYAYLELSNEINLNTGGINVDLNVAPLKGNADKYKIMFELSTRVLYPSMNKAFELMKEIIRGSILVDKKRIKDIIEEIRSELKGKMEASGNATAVDRALSYSSKSSYLQNQMSGIGFYRFIDDLCNRFDELSDSLIDILETLIYKIFRKEHLLISFTADDEGYGCFEDESYDLLEALYEYDNDELPEKLPVFSEEMSKKNEGFKTPGKVQYVARTGNFAKSGFDYTGHLKVAATILSYNYLWVKVRIKGGAYGAMCGFRRSGNAYFVSYRDPNLRETNEVYKGIPEYLETFEADEREMTKFIIGTMSDLDAPLTPRTKGRLSYSLYLSEVNQFDLQKERDEVLSINVEDIRKCAKIVQSILDEGNICVIGSDAAIDTDKDMFLSVTNLT